MLVFMVIQHHFMASWGFLRVVMVFMVHRLQGMEFWLTQMAQASVCGQVTVQQEWRFWLRVIRGYRGSLVRAIHWVRTLQPH